MSTKGHAPRAWALTAGLALGTCLVSACDDQAEAPSAQPAEISERRAAPAPRRVEPDLDGDQARLAVVDLSPGFTPDPARWSGQTAATAVDLNDFDDRCAGWTAVEPDLLVHARRPFAELFVMAASNQDTTLLVVDADGEHHCADDIEGQHPLLAVAVEEGPLRVWVGIKPRGGTASFELAVSELEDTQPASLLESP